jgi:hypothetical protein
VYICTHLHTYICGKLLILTLCCLSFDHFTLCIILHDSIQENVMNTHGSFYSVVWLFNLRANNNQYSRLSAVEEDGCQVRRPLRGLQWLHSDCLRAQHDNRGGTWHVKLDAGGEVAMVATSTVTHVDIIEAMSTPEPYGLWSGGFELYVGAQELTFQGCNKRSKVSGRPRTVGFFRSSTAALCAPLWQLLKIQYESICNLRLLKYTCQVSAWEA